MTICVSVNLPKLHRALPSFVTQDGEVPQLANPREKIAIKLAGPKKETAPAHANLSESPSLQTPGLAESK